MHCFKCKKCGQLSYSAASLESLYDPYCSTCRGALEEISKEEARTIKKNPSLQPAELEQTKRE